MGAGLLNKGCRFLLQGEDSSHLTFLPNVAIHEITGIEGYLSLICNHLHREKIIDITPAEFFRRLLDSEIVFRVRDEMRFIFSIKDFIEYINNIEQLSSEQCAIIRNMYKLIQMLSADQTSRLAPGIKECIEKLFNERKDKVECLTQFFTQMRFSKGLQRVTSSFLNLPDIDIDTTETSRIMSSNNAPRT